MIIIIGMIFVLIDQLIKYMILDNFILGHSMPIIKDFLYITYIKNTGIAFGLFKNNNIFMIIVITIIIILLLYFYYSEKKKSLVLSISIMFLVSGAIGNLIDRMIRGFIIDYINFTFWPAFNLADTLVVIGSFLLGFYIIFKVE
ncbi:MAG: signal peptidase II [Halanaerobiales bacterium]|nr:signal peptidase II [Halanaerobiales bacterium]